MEPWDSGMEPWYVSIEMAHTIYILTMDSQLLTVVSTQFMTAL